MPPPLNGSEPQTASPKLKVQNALPTDAEDIAKIGATTFAASFLHSMPAEHMQAYLDEAYTPTAISRDIANKQNQFFVARQSAGAPTETGQVVGFIQMKLGTTEPCIPRNVPMCEVHRIYVSVDHHGGGVGQLMMERGLEWARDQLLGPKDVDVGWKERRAGVWLGVWEENVKAQRFYERLGFEEQLGTHDFVMGGTKQTDLLIVKWL